MMSHRIACHTTHKHTHVYVKCYNKWSYIELRLLVMDSVLFLRKAIRIKHWQYCLFSFPFSVKMRALAMNPDLTILKESMDVLIRVCNKSKAFQPRNSLHTIPSRAIPHHPASHITPFHLRNCNHLIARHTKPVHTTPHHTRPHHTR